MSGLGLFSPIYGIDLLHAQQAQAISNEALIAKYAPMIAQGQRDYQQLLAQRNYQLPNKPLDERFADFKRRLDAAVAKRRRI
jgi:hypothetical protein